MHDLASICCCSSTHHFQRSSPKQLGQSKPCISCGASMGRGTKACVNGPGHMTKMAPTSIYCKTFKISFSRTRSRINDDPGLPLTYFRPRPNFVTFVLELTKLSQIHLMRKTCSKNDQIGRRLGKSASRRVAWS